MVVDIDVVVVAAVENCSVGCIEVERCCGDIAHGSIAVLKTRMMT